MIGIQTTFKIPDWIEQGLKNGEYIRVGGVIREAKTKQIVAMLREVAPDISQYSDLLTQVSSAASFLNLGVSILNLGVSIVGFGLILKKINQLEGCLKNCFKEELNKFQENINHLHRKIDISVYADFKAAINLAHEATTAIQADTRKSMFLSALMELLKSKNTFSDSLDDSLKEDSIKKDINIVDQYILSLLLVYITRARCYLELEEINNAILCLQEGTNFLRIRVEQYVKTLLISQPIARVIPKTLGDNFVILGVGSSLESTVDINRLARICKWLEPEFNSNLDDQSILFKSQERNLVKFHIEEINTGVYNLGLAHFTPVQDNIVTSVVGAAVVTATSVFPILTIPVALGMVTGVAIQGIQDCFKDENTNPATEELAEEQPDTHTKKQINANNLLKVIENIEQIIETYNRFESYLVEVQAIQQLGMSFKNWLQLTTHTEAQEYKAERVYIIPSQPLVLN